jgi:hypothetical protein
MSHHKWASPCEWLVDVYHNWDEEVLRMNLLALAMRSNPNTLQNIFKKEMEETGYFGEDKE